ncbi:MAG: DUF4382 domain-containing protein, partial [Terriglobia bacterium]
MSVRTLSSGTCLPLLALALVATGLVGCSGADPATQTIFPVTGTITTSLSDPPVCKGLGSPSDLQFDNVWVTVTRVRAPRAAGADGDDPGWVDLADLTAAPLQIDLLADTGGQCILAILGITDMLPAGNYQQIRIHLLSNTPGANEATPSPNMCAAADRAGFNCARVSGGALETLELSSQANTGLKIPPGQLGGGGLMLEAGQTADINIDFDACTSIVRDDSGFLRLKPTLRAAELAVADTISGRAVDNAAGNPLPAPADIVVLAEQVDSDSIGRVVLQTLADASSGQFTLCPLPAGDYDVVIAASDANGVTYNATVTFDVPAGTAMGDVPLEPETGVNTSPGELAGNVTAADNSSPAAIDVQLSALQLLDNAGAMILATVPVLGGSTDTLTTGADGLAAYRLFVPASNPLVGTFSAGGTTYTA